jgi:hypothetical protein
MSHSAQPEETDILKLPPTKNWRAMVAIGLLDSLEEGLMRFLRVFKVILCSRWYQKFLSCETLMGRTGMPLTDHRPR